MHALVNSSKGDLVGLLRAGGFKYKLEEPGTMIVLPANHLLLMADISHDIGGSSGVRRGMTGWDGCLEKVLLAMHAMDESYPGMQQSTIFQSWKETVQNDILGVTT